MNKEQIDALVKQLKAQGKSDEEIMDIYYETFVNGKMDRKDLETLANHLGYELTDDFKEDKTEDPINMPKDLDKADLEDAKTIDKDETAEEFKDKVEDMKDEEGDTDTDSDKEEVDEDEERKEAMKLFRL